MQHARGVRQSVSLACVRCALQDPHPFRRRPLDGRHSPLRSPSSSSANERGRKSQGSRYGRTSSPLSDRRILPLTTVGTISGATSLLVSDGEAQTSEYAIRTATCRCPSAPPRASIYPARSSSVPLRRSGTASRSSRPWTGTRSARQRVARASMGADKYRYIVHGRSDVGFVRRRRHGASSSAHWMLCLEYAGRFALMVCSMDFLLLYYLLCRRLAWA